MVDAGSRIALYEPGLPPPSEVASKRYQYTPCPLDPEEPMPSHLFFHFFYTPPRYHSSSGKWMHRLPKKLTESIFSATDQIPVGWGIHILETPNMHVMSTMVLVGLVFSGCLSVIWACLTRDVQGAFGIGSYFATVQAAWMSSMFFKWSQE